MKEIGSHVGTGSKASDWLQIPITARVHVGDEGIDYGIGVATWEERHGTQVEMLKKVSRVVGYNVFEMAGLTGVEI